ncbi:MAG: precorrin-6y C5,15-methyltransferase (decarboxylating) subunit CbiE [Desulfomicrobium sp.]|nr:precorrin-6y C5,15-methyltransferase (decarboxylating) subunit CbiE [Desulfomicrobium sp.]
MIHVLGLGLCPAHRSPEIADLISSADLVAGGRRLLDELGITEDRRLALGSMDEFAARIRDRAQDGNVCVLADGDPLLYGIGASLLRFFAPHELTFHPNVSAMQTACARFGLPWHDCKTLSLHGRSDLAPLFAALSHGSLVALYTDQQHSPDAIAELLLERGVKGWRMHVAENLCAPEERLTTLTLAEATQRRWHTLNLVLLERTEAPPLTLELGLDDSALAHDQGLMTKQPVRAFALSLLRLTPDATLWDLGAGSGAVSLEAARLLRKGQVVAVERQPERVAHIRQNVARTGAWLVEAVHASLEEFLDSHPSPPTHIFLGGGASAPVLAQCAALLSSGGRMVVAAVLLSTLEAARAAFTQRDWPLTVHQLMHHASSPLGGDLRLVPSNPVFLLETQKPSSDT